MWLNVPDEIMCLFASGKWVDHPDPSYMGEYNMTTDCPSFVRDYDCKRPNSPNLVPPDLIRSQYRCTLFLHPVNTAFLQSVVLCLVGSTAALLSSRHTCQQKHNLKCRANTFRRMHAQ